ncbi:hypothetical protein BDA96_03G249500 [Sorghum bicolor]|uniref:DUF4408 domain-containing protein n=1 Tax=Sorghum bicolor TaxID=4558 RepID=A0A921RGL3_SORBI|nr:hypothetical protein BDA96_03G249500 [Sorghum bicolor]
MAAAAAAADARAALSRPRVVARVLVHAAQVVGLAVLLRALAESPWAAAAGPSILRVAAFFLSPPRLCFLAVHVIVIVLARFIPRDAASLTPSSFADPSGSPTTSSNGDAPPQQHPILALLEDTKQTQQLPPITESEPGSGEEASPPPEDVFVDKEAVHVTTVRVAQPPLRTMSENTGGGAADKEAVQAKTVRAKPPRRTMSDKTRDGGAAAGRTSTAAAAASPELRRAKSENGRRRQRRSAAAAAAPVELVTDDAEAFRQAVEAFIAKQQTWFHREESLILARASAAAAADTGVEDRRRCCCGGREVSA